MKNSTSLIPVSLLITLSGCLSPDMKTESIGKRVNVIRSNNQKTIVVADFSSPISLSPIEKGWHHQEFMFTNPMKISFVNYKDIPAIRFFTAERVLPSKCDFIKLAAKKYLCSIKAFSAVTRRPR